MSWGRRLVLVLTTLLVASQTGEAQQRPPVQPVAPVAPSVVATPLGSSVTSPHGANLRVACASCHSANAWKPARISTGFVHAEKTFPLNGAHERAPCASCHKALDFTSTPTSCASCHTDRHQGEFGTTCARCHNTRSFVDRGAAVRTHQATRFPLRGAHAIATCEACHTSGAPGQPQFAARATTCESCHLPTFRATRSPNHEMAHFSRDCTSCHTISTWSGATFDHNATKFPLTGKHSVTTCVGCHSDNVFTGKSTSCVSCHRADYTTAKEPVHAGFATTCESCHGTAQWQGAKFDHQTQTKYPLTGAHLTATCRACHTSGVYAGLPSTCVSCHQGTYDKTTTPAHKAAGFPTTCEGCHTNTTAWTGAFNHNATRFPLTGGHRAVTCASCHSDGVYRGKTMLCVGCHQAKFDATSAPPHVAARFATTCEGCHTTAGWSPAPFDHNANTKFALLGKHVGPTCLACHGDKVYVGKSSVCASCHQRDYDAAVNPNHKTSGFPAVCETCHTPSGWKPATFDHATTRFPLTGNHRAVTCAGCHADNVFRGKTMVCAGCHQAKFDATSAPPHAAARFASTCESCHTTTGWTPAPYDHSKTAFALTGKHVTTTCMACHADKVFAGKPSACASCHQAKYDATTNPNHKANGFPTTCQTCHGTAAWNGAAFDHSVTRFPLTGNHRAVTCSGCHADNVFRGKTMVCAGCHQAKFDATSAPPHAAARFASTCESCHTTSGWTPAPYDHSKTAFALTGKHLTTTCMACHADKVFAGKPSACASCHQAKYDATTNPNHKANGFPTTCQTCHGTGSWSGASFDHSVTRFPLTGNHRAVTCSGCHADNVFRGKTMVCSGCHQAKYDATTAPPHAAARFASTCESCHTTAGWTPAPYDHSKTQFALTGKHVTTTCMACHADKVFAGKPSACASCHQAKYDATTNPNHKANGFPATCQTCHGTGSWSGASFDHSVTRFPLTGNHRAVTCAGCHADNVFRGKTMVCSGCHQAKYDATTAPPHAAARFASTCESCHTTAGWTPAPYDHSKTQFALTGKHVTTTCMACHADKVFAGKPSACASCHQAKYDATTNPNHKANGFPLTCQTCHGTAAWNGAAFDHNATRFPLTGNHRAVTCSGCHADNVFRGKTMTCVGCHQAKYDATSNPHHGPARFATTCESCHTTSGWTPSPFDHAKTGWALLGRHLSQTCLACHADKVYAGKPTVCVSCHQAKYNATTNPNHRTLGYPTTCETCHSVNAWTPSTFNHATTRFPLVGSHLAVSCIGCHGDGVYRGKTMTCVGCHQAKFNATTKPNHATSGFPTTCETCHTPTAWTPATFDHATTRFPLVGSHRTVTCAGCHGDGVYRGKTMLCSGCHQAKFNATTKPNHVTSGFPTTCETCHTPTAWTPASFDHNATRFPLTGNHRAVSCTSCHGDGVYRGKTMLCVGCHQAKFDATSNPHHGPARFATTCESCHTTNGWTPTPYDHSKTGWALTGKHLAQTCLACHSDKVYAGKPTICASCHQAKFDATTNPNHRASGFPTTCETCHSSAAWTPATFNHATTRFPLTGKHAAVTCTGCHGDGVFRGKTMVCSGCHQAKYAATSKPNHTTVAFATTCESCHNTAGWVPSTWSHSTTRFPLAGGHLAVTCSGCHGDGVFRGKPMTCVSCHQAKFTATTKPSHTASGFPTTCETCHSVNAWTPATFNHATTRFPLTGLHATVSCTGCHGDGVFKGKTMVCSGCHLTKYNATTKPNHTTVAFATTCESCHTTAGWVPSSWSHSVTRFPLTGAHVAQTCLACHGDGVYRGKSMVCSSCHLTAYNATTNPNHKTASFPTTCETCHTTTQWKGATFNHDGWFPIYSGKHKQAWTSCTQCHTNSANYKDFTCLSCHEHAQTTMDAKHRGRSGYAYQSPLCYSCHPRGSAG